jgi:DNA-binding XRE family transcriptional regulator
MSSQILRPTKRGENKNKAKWLIQGPWGKKEYPPQTKTELYKVIRDELIESQVHDSTTPLTSNNYHANVTLVIPRCSFIEGKWVLDESFSARLKKLREQKGFTQEELAVKSEIDLGTVRQLEQATRTNPQWQTVCALARGLEMDVRVFAGTEGYVLVTS